MVHTVSGRAAPLLTTCLFCRTPFPPNREIEHLPVGRRIAHDEARGRLWVVCGTCSRWNLAPFEDRWEAIEECERHFRRTHVRVSSDNVGLARLSEGLELVRIGDPLRPEFAAWRYGQRFQRRYRRRLIHAAGSLSAAGMVGAVPFVAGLLGPLPAVALGTTAAIAAFRRWKDPAVTVTVEGEGRREELQLNLAHVRGAVLIRDDTVPEGWGLMVEHPVETRPSGFRRFLEPLAIGSTTLSGTDARLVAALVLPRVNALGGDTSDVDEAVRWLEAAGGPSRAFRTLAWAPLVRPALDAHRGTMLSMHPGVRLALEMALHEDEERRALQGELSILAWAWQREERLAGIADRLGITTDLAEQLDRLRDHVAGSGSPSLPREPDAPPAIDPM